MWDEVLKAIPVVVFSMLKFILGPSMGYAVKLHIITTIFSTVLGMMVSVFGCTYFATWIKQRFAKWFEKHKLSTKNKRLARIWKRYGLAGIAALTPVILTPIGGTLLAVSMGSPRDRIIIYMFISAAVWSVIFSFAIYIFGNNILPDFIRPEN